MARVFLSLGSNVGDRRRHLQEALTQLQPLGNVLAVSSLYDSGPLGYANQPRFLNIVVSLETEMPPADLLAAVKQIERQLGRQKTFRWGPRNIDIDIVLYGETIVHSDNLTIPHLRYRERGFVLAPLAEIAPEARDPTDGATAGRLFASLAPQDVRRLTGPEGSLSDV